MHCLGINNLKDLPNEKEFRENSRKKINYETLNNSTNIKYINNLFGYRESISKINSENGYICLKVHFKIEIIVF